uniref:RNA polymerase sigma factor n=1 Tax=Nocardioides sp. TaxID=35761 RepID=UPI0025F8F730
MTGESSPTLTDRAITAVWRHESVRLVAALARMTRDLDLAEDLAQDALVAALEQWPGQGVPANPGAWLTAVAKRRAIDHFRRSDTLRRRTAELAHGLEETVMPDLEAAVDHIEDDVLRLAFVCCHPVLAPEARAALTLRLVGGLTTSEIARAYLVKEATMGQRVSRAKRLLAERGVSMDLPTGPQRAERLADVMGVVYLIFNEGYAATAGDDWTRPELCREAMRLARILAALAPDDPEVHGLQALVELQGSRLPARHAPDGTPVLLDHQDRRRWDQLLVRRGLAALGRADELAGAGRPIGTYVLQASIAACHARAIRPEDTDWTEIARLYDVLARAAPGPVVEVNRAVAHGRAFGPDAGLAVLEAVAAEPA